MKFGQSLLVLGTVALGVAFVTPAQAGCIATATGLSCTSAVSMTNLGSLDPKLLVVYSSYQTQTNVVGSPSVSSLPSFNFSSLFSWMK